MKLIVFLFLPIFSFGQIKLDQKVNLLAQYTNQKWEEKEIAEYKDLRVANLKKTRTDMQILKEGVTDINGKKVGFFKFMTQAIDSKIFNYYFFTVVDEKVLIFTFNCKEALRNSWEKIADEIANSLTVK